MYISCLKTLPQRIIAHLQSVQYFVTVACPGALMFIEVGTSKPSVELQELFFLAAKKQRLLY
jgi:hypothetical protein